MGNIYNITDLRCPEAIVFTRGEIEEHFYILDNSEDYLLLIK